MFQFSGLATLRFLYLQYKGLPHSEISGSKVVCTSPKLIAAYHVLHRLWEPRHSPYALNYFLSTLLLGYSVNLKTNIVYFLSICQRTVEIVWNPVLKGIRHTRFSITVFIPKWRIRESNPWPLACKASALASWANSPKRFCSPGQSWTADPYIISVVL